MSRVNSSYSISYKGLKDGQHTFTFTLDEAFFGLFAEGEVQRGLLRADVSLQRTGHLMLLRCLIEGHVNLTCDRCLEPLELPLRYQGNLYVQTGQEAQTAPITDDEYIYQPDSEAHIDLAQYFYESISLSLPLERYHGLNGTREADCNPDMLRRMHQPAEPEDAMDPRWQQLAALRTSK